MRIKKVDSKSIFLHEETEVKFKTAGSIREVQFSAGVNRKCPIQNISKDKYLDRERGEINERKKSENCYQSPKSVRKSINKLMDLIQCNVTEVVTVQPSYTARCFTSVKPENFMRQSALLALCVHQILQ